MGRTNVLQCAHNLITRAESNIKTNHDFVNLAFFALNLSISFRSVFLCFVLIPKKMSHTQSSLIARMSILSQKTFNQARNLVRDPSQTNSSLIVHYNSKSESKIISTLIRLNNLRSCRIKKFYFILTKKSSIGWKLSFNPNFFFLCSVPDNSPPLYELCSE